MRSTHRDGLLTIARTGEGKWISLDLAGEPFERLKQRFNPPAALQGSGGADNSGALWQAQMLAATRFDLVDKIDRARTPFSMTDVGFDRGSSARRDRLIVTEAVTPSAAFTAHLNSDKTPGI